jgi:hypothetical protein
VKLSMLQSRMTLHSSPDIRGSADVVRNRDNVVVVASFPCTGGCFFNAGINASNPKCAPKLEAHWRLLKKNGEHLLD